MGQQFSDIKSYVQNYKFPKHQYHQIGHKIWQHNQNSFNQIKEIKIFFQSQHSIQTYLKVFHFRKSSDFLVKTLYLDLQEEKQLCSHKKTGTVYIQSDQLRLSDITDIPYPDYLHLFYQSLRGFYQLYQEFGGFSLEQEHFCINSNSVVKVWFNSNYESSNIQHPMSINSQKQMVRQVMHILKRNCDNGDLNLYLDQNTNINKTNVKKIKKFEQKLFQCQSFKNAIQVLNQFCKQQNMIIPDKLQCLQRHGLIITKQQEEKQCKYFDLFSTVNTKMKRYDDMKLSQQNIKIKKLEQYLDQDIVKDDKHQVNIKNNRLQQTSTGNYGYYINQKLNHQRNRNNIVTHQVNPSVNYTYNLHYFPMQNYNYRNQSKNQFQRNLNPNQYKVISYPIYSNNHYNQHFSTKQFNQYRQRRKNFSPPIKFNNANINIHIQPSNQHRIQYLKKNISYQRPKPIITFLQSQIQNRMFSFTKQNEKYKNTTPIKHHNYHVNNSLEIVNRKNIQNKSSSLIQKRQNQKTINQKIYRKNQLNKYAIQLSNYQSLQKILSLDLYKDLEQIKANQKPI